MKHNGDCTYIISAFKKERSERENIQAHNELLTLLSEKYGAREAEGAYQGETELNCVVVATHGAEQALRSIAADFGQECMLKIYSDNWTEFVAPNGNRLGAGHFKQLPENEAKQRVGYTKVGNAFFTVVQLP